MISRLGVENRTINSPYMTQNSNKPASREPSFKAGGVFSLILQGIQACERNPMINVAVIDMFSAILPRTFVESLTNWFAGFEAFRRESSGLIVNCMIPGVITLGVAKLLNKGIMPNSTNMSSCWADSNMLLHISDIYKDSNAKDKVEDTFKQLLEGIEGFDGDKKYSYKDILSRKEIEEYAVKLKELSNKDLDNDLRKKEIKKLIEKITEKTKIYENIAVKNGSKATKVHTLESLLMDSTKFFKEYSKIEGNISVEEFAKKSKKLVRAKSLLGLGIILPLAGSMQFINRWITEKVSGVKGAPIYNDFGEEKSEHARRKSKEGLLKQKIISISSMICVGLLSMLKMPTINMLEFKGIFPTMDQARIISTTTFASRMVAADDRHELAEATVRDIATFLSLYFLGDYAAKGAATYFEKKKGIKLLNDTKPIAKDSKWHKKLWHWFKDVNIKATEEVAGIKAKNYRRACQVANMGVSLTLLGLVIPIFVRKQTEKKHAADIEQAERDIASKQTKNSVKPDLEKIRA